MILAIFSGSGVDGLWSDDGELSQIGVVRESRKPTGSPLRTFQATSPTSDLGDTSFADVRDGGSFGADFWTNKRMPAKAAHVAQANPLPRRALGDGCKCRDEDRVYVRTWGSRSRIDDIYSGACER